MFAILLGLINPIASIVGKLADAKVALAQAQTDEERIHAQERVATLQARADVMRAESQGPYGWINPAVRLGFAFPFVVYNAKLVVWDKVLGLGVTVGSLGNELFYVECAVIGFYFLYEMVKLKR